MIVQKFGFHNPLLGGSLMSLFGMRLLFTGCTSYLVLYAIQRGIRALQAAAVLSRFHIFGLPGLRNRIALPIHLRCAACHMGDVRGLKTAERSF